MITDYHFGSVTVEGHTYRSDVIIYPERVQENWWRKEGHSLQLADMEGIMAQDPQVLVVGTGAYGGLKVSAEVRDALSNLGIKLIARKTAEACAEYNTLVKAGTRVVAALHLTC